MRTALTSLIAAVLLVPALAAAPAVATAGPEAGTAAAADSATVDLMPGASSVQRVAITDDAVYAVSHEPARGPELFSRTLEVTEGGTTLGPATRVGRASDVHDLVAGDGTLAYVDEQGGLVLREGDGTETRPEWGAPEDLGYRGVMAVSDAWVVIDGRLVDRQSGAAVDLLTVWGVTPDGAPITDVPAEVGDLWVTRAAVSDDRAVWVLSGASSDGPPLTTYRAIMVAELDEDGPVAPAVRVDMSASGSEPEAVQLDVVGLTDAGVPVWLRKDWGGLHPELRWLPGALDAAPSSVAVGSGFADAAKLAMDDTVAALLVDGVDEQGERFEEVRWFDVSGEPTGPVATAELTGVVTARGPLVARIGPTSGLALLTDSRGLPITADQPPPVVRYHDVGLAHPFHGDIDWMTVNGLAFGYDDGGFHPTAPVSRQAMAAFLHRVAGSPYSDWDGNPPFPDVQWDNPFIRDVAWLRGFADGYPDGLFHPTAPVTRQSMAAFLYRLAGRPEVTVDGAPFPDVPADHAFTEAVTWLAETGIAGGYDDGTFRPTAPVSRQAMAAFIHRFVDGGYAPA